MSEESKSLIAVCPLCDGIIFAQVVTRRPLERSSRKAVADLAGDGFTICTVTSEEVRTGPRKFGCQQKPCLRKTKLPRSAATTP